MTKLTRKEFFNGCGLTENPFLDNPTSWDVDQAGVWAAYDQEKQKLWRVLDQARADSLRSKTMFLLYGNFGTGKTHALLWSAYQILIANKDVFNASVYFVRRVKVEGKFGFLKPWETFILEESELCRELQEYKNWINAKLVIYQSEQGMDVSANLDDTVKKLFGQPAVVNLVNRIRSANTDDEVQKIIKVSTGEEAATLFSRIANIFTKNIPSETIEENCFRKAVYLFIDELDSLGEAKPPERANINALIRTLYDECPNECFVLGLGITAEVTELEYYFEPYVLTRINTEIELSSLTASDCEDYILGLIDNNRCEGKYPKYFPFERDALQHLINEMPDIRPRLIMVKFKALMNYLYAQGFSPDKKETITLDVLDKYNVVEEVIY